MKEKKVAEKIFNLITRYIIPVCNNEYLGEKNEAT